MAFDDELIRPRNKLKKCDVSHSATGIKMMEQKKPRLIILYRPDGAGTTTITEKLLRHVYNVKKGRVEDVEVY